jgi:hypothetical protein
LASMRAQSRNPVKRGFSTAIIYPNPNFIVEVGHKGFDFVAN